MKFAVHNFGCRASQADGAAIEQLLIENGLERAAADCDASVFILNSCTVTASADDELRHIVRRIHRSHSDAQIVVTGCYAQRAPEQIAALPGVSLVVGNSHKANLAEFLLAPYHGQIHVGDIGSEFQRIPIESAANDRSRPNLKIQDGCNHRCSFCVIPSVRGRSRSMPADDVIASIRQVSEHSAEVVLTGINLGRWGREPGSAMRLAGLLLRILNETPIQRVRLSSVEPMDFSDELLALMADNPRVAQHVHAPLQSGAATVLRRMRRKYRPQHYEDRIRQARALMPDAAIGADVMVGFPGETAAEFNETRGFIERLPFTYLHVFPYSERPGTPAAELPGQVPAAVRRERAAILKALGERKNLEFRRSMLHRTLSAAMLDDGSALTTNYLRLAVAHLRPRRTLFDAEIAGVSGAGLSERALLPVLG